MNKYLKIIIGITILLIGISVFYYFVIFLPQKEKTKLEQEQKNAEIRKNCANEYSGFVPSTFISISDQKIRNEESYENCLRKNGIEK